MSHLSISVDSKYSVLDIYKFIKEQWFPRIWFDLLVWYSSDPHLNIEGTNIDIQLPAISRNWILNYFLSWHDIYSKKPDYCEESVKERCKQYEKQWEVGKAEKLRWIKWLAHDEQKDLWWKLGNEFWAKEDKENGLKMPEEYVKDLDWNMINISDFLEKNRPKEDSFLLNVYSWKDVLDKIKKEGV